MDNPTGSARWLWLKVALLTSCASHAGHFPSAPPIWTDDDRRPFAPRPAPYHTTLAWDGMNQTVFLPASRFLAVDPASEATNVNAVDEVPDSSWFENRIGRFALSPAEVARGPCDGYAPPDPQATWEIVSGKPEGANPGFVFETGGVRYLAKLDNTLQGPQSSAADVAGARLFHAAGYFVPCNRVAYLLPSNLRIRPTAKVENDQGRECPMTPAHVDLLLANGLRLHDGRYRVMVSLWLKGKGLGQWRYQGTRSDDPNDVVPHEDRRELRGMRLLSAWINHFDSREANTLVTWHDVGGGRGYLRHNLLDFGDSLGSLWEPPTLARSLGHSYYLDIGTMGEDFLTLGMIQRPWETATYGPSGQVFGYFGVTDFDPEAWRPGYPNPAFGRAQEHDLAWMARIISRFSDAHVRAIVGTTDLRSQVLEEELYRILIGRRDKILRRYLGRLSPLSDPALRTGPAGIDLCLKDLLLAAGLAVPGDRAYSARAWPGGKPPSVGLESVALHSAALVCARLPDKHASTLAPYAVVDVSGYTAQGRAEPPARVHLRREGARGYVVVGLERPERNRPPE